MKSILITTLLVLSTNAMAASTLKIPLQFEGGKTAIPASEINKKLRKVGAPLVPEFIEISTEEDGYKKLKALDAQIDKSVKALGKEGEYLTRDSEYVPGSNNTKDLVTCYTGKVEEVVDIIGSLADSAYSDQMVMFAYKFKKQTEILNDDKEKTEKFLNDGSKLWKEWRGNGMAILTVASIGDSGDDINESIIPLCK